MADDLTSIPGVGKSIAQDFRDIGIYEVADLVGRDPEKMYADLCALRGQHIDRCMLYVMRCAVFYAEWPPMPGIDGSPDPELYKWWNWSDAKLKAGG